MSSHSEYSNSPWSGRGNLAQLVKELERQKDSTFDFVTDSRNMRIEIGEKDGTPIPHLISTGADRNLTEFIPSHGLPVSDKAIAQLGGRLAPSVPIKFLRSLIATQPKIASDLLSDLLTATQSTNLVRTLDGRVRAFLSDRYQPLDNYQIAFAALEVAQQTGAEIVEASLSDTRMRIKFVNRNVWDAVNEIKQGDRGSWYSGGLGSQEYLGKVAANTKGDLPGGPGTIHPIVTIGNSETGHGSHFMRMGILQAICFNIATVEQILNQIHLGSRLDPGIYSQETMRKEAEAVMCKARDNIGTAFNTNRFKAIVAKVNAANEVPVEPTKVVDFAVAENVVAQEKRDDLLAHFLGESAAGLVGHTAYGFAQGLARFAQDIEDPDDAAEIEHFAGMHFLQPFSLPHFLKGKIMFRSTIHGIPAWSVYAFLIVGILLAILIASSARGDPCFPPGEGFIHRGDVNCSGGEPNMTDVIQLNEFILDNDFNWDPIPCCFEGADVNGDGVISPLDTVALLAYLFNGCGGCLALPHCPCML
jgi:hypothetical protein